MLQRPRRLEVSRFAITKPCTTSLEPASIGCPICCGSRLTQVVEGYTGQCDVEAAGVASIGCADSIAPRASGRRSNDDVYGFLPPARKSNLLASGARPRLPWLKTHIMAADDILLALMLGVVLVAVGSVIVAAIELFRL